MFGPRKSDAALRRFHPRLETLEDRCLPSLSAFLLQSYNNPTPAAGDSFGQTIAALSNDRVLVGVPSANGGVGEVVLLNASTGAVLRTFTHPNPGAHTAGVALAFGGAVTAIGTDKVLIGAEGADTAATDAGEAYLFDVNTGNLLRTFLNPSPGAGDAFGGRVAALGTTQLMIAADRDDPGGTVDAGTFYLFDVATGNLVRTFNRTTPVAGERFGLWLAPMGTNQILVGTPQGEIRPSFADGSFEIDASGPGAVYLYDAGTGAVVRTFANPTPVTGDLFGWQVAAVGTSKVVIAAPGDEDSNNTGAAYLFDATTGNLLQTYTNPQSLLLGLSVGSAGNDRFFIGSPGDLAGDGSMRGAVYFVDLTANEVLRIEGPRAQDRLGFGASVAGLTPTKLLVGAPGDNTGAAQAGAGFYYDVPRPVPVLVTMAAGDRQLFGLDDENRLWRLRDGVWTAAGGWGATVAVGNTGDSDSANDVVYLRTFDDRLWTWNQSSWNYTGGYLPSVIGSDGQAFGLGFDGQVWKYNLTTGWTASGGWGVHIEVGGVGDGNAANDIVFMHSADSRVWTWDQVSWNFSGGWLPSFQAGDGQIFGLGFDGQLWRYSLASGWVATGGWGVEIAVGNLGDGDGASDVVYMRSADSRIWFWGGGGWVFTGGYLASIIGGDSQVLGRGLDGQLWRYRLLGGGVWGSHSSNGGTTLAVGGDGDSLSTNDLLFQLAANGTISLWDQNT